MTDRIKSFGAFALEIAIFIGIGVVAGLFFFDVAKIAETIVPILNLIVMASFGLLVVGALPLAFFRRTRLFSAMAFYLWTFVCGFDLWLLCVAVCFQIWGLAAVIVGFLFLGMGVIPIAIIGALLNRDWSLGFGIIGQIIWIVLVRLFAEFLGNKAEDDPFVQPEIVAPETAARDR